MTVGNSKSMSSKSLIPPIIPIIPRVLGQEPFGHFQIYACFNYSTSYKYYHYLMCLCASQMEGYLLENSIFMFVLTSLSVHNSNSSTYFQSAGSLC